MKRAFSLVELIVVIGIIGILAGILLTSFSGGTESARAAKCLNNMRSLAQGVNSSAAADDDGHMPGAGSFAELEEKNSAQYYKENIGWISWLCQDDEYATRGKKTTLTTSFVSVPNASAYCDDDDKAMFAITNGRLWKAVNGNLDIYVCPEHKIACDKKGAKLRWSYVMNSWFGYDSSNGSKAIFAHITGMRYPLKKMDSPGIRPDRRLLFAELPIYGSGKRIDEGGKQAGATYTDSTSTETDCVLQYKASIIGIEQKYFKWNGTSESIAFNHKSNKRYCAHVVFADGHTEKILKPKDGGGISEEQLTVLLCTGKDIGFDGKVYTWVNSTDKNGDD